MFTTKLEWLIDFIGLSAAQKEIIINSKLPMTIKIIVLTKDALYFGKKAREEIIYINLFLMNNKLFCLEDLYEIKNKLLKWKLINLEILNYSTLTDNVCLYDFNMSRKCLRQWLLTIFEIDEVYKLYYELFEKSKISFNYGGYNYIISVKGPHTKCEVFKRL